MQKRPYDVQVCDEFVEMASDTSLGYPNNFTVAHHGHYVSIHAPRSFHVLQIPRDQFNAIVDWYTAPQEVKAQVKE